MIFTVFLAALAFCAGHMLGRVQGTRRQKRPPKPKRGEGSAQSGVSNFLSYDGSQQE